MNGETARGLVPPRPNLGPEPWPEPAATPWLAIAMSAAAIVALLAAWAWRRRKAPRGRQTPSTPGASAAADPGPRGRLVSLSESVRDALTTRFGQSFRARTTEELAVDDRLVELLGEDGFRDLMQFLDRVDRVKFAPERPAGQDGELEESLRTWEPMIAAMSARIRSRPRNARHREESGSAPDAAIPRRLRGPRRDGGPLAG